ncbi:hypothetical protein LCGC14_0461860, partial [marine sediment metagenome]
MVKKKVFFLVGILILLIPISLISSEEFAYNIVTDSDFMKRIGGSGIGDFSFNGLCLNGGIELREDGTICGQALEVFNITSVNVTKQTITVLEDFIVEGNITASYFIGSLMGNTSIWSRAGTNTFLTNLGDNVGIGTTSPQNKLNVVGDFNVSNGNIYASNNLTIADFFFLSNSYSLPPGQNKILKRNSATKAVFGVQNEIADASADSGAGYVLNTSVGEYRIDLHSALDLNNPNDTVHHLLGANNREIWRLNPNSDSSFIFEGSLDSEIVMINRTGLFVTGDVNITGDLYVNSSSLYIGSEKISYAHGDDDGIMLSGSIHLEARDGVGGNIALHEGTEPLVCVSNDGGRL